MDDDMVSRTNVLTIRLRDRIKRLALLQCTIQDDVDSFSNGGPEFRIWFNETRTKYLYMLDMSVGQLREAMQSEIEHPGDDTEVEEIMKRVTPVPRYFLRDLVREGHITQEDMECILAGGYTSVDAFFDDLQNNVGSFGLNSEADQLSTNDNSPGAYDENSTLSDEVQGHKFQPNEAAPEHPQPEPHSSERVVPPVVSLPRSGSFSWADDVEEELESMKSPDTPAIGPTSPSSPPPLEEHTQSDVEATMSDSDNESSEFDMDVNHQKSSMSTFDPQLCAKSDEEENVDAEITENLAEASSKPTLDLSNQVEESKPAIVQAYLKSSRPTDGDEILDIWLEDHNMWFWQYEVVFAAKLVERKFKEDFQNAREVYKIDPFAEAS
ncbi:hypothetical protein F5Y13DRAFT_202201 [Hypoxylon sp. FL1857]|nr:hypothetical protein F5Y13DRAFT_202201 [Hypoxylon sp. FL1857]